MVMTHYELCSPKRALLPVSAVFLALPWIFTDDLMNYYTFPIFYFFGSYFIFLNFPSIGENLHAKPIYVQDLIMVEDIENNEVFKKTYSIIMNVILAILFAFFSEYVIIKGIDDRPVVEICGIIGGNISIYMKAQNMVGKILLNFCYTMKERKRRMSEDLRDGIEMNEV